MAGAIFKQPDAASVRGRHHHVVTGLKTKLPAAVLTEQNDEWIEARRYMGLEILAACKEGRNATETTRME